MLTLYRIVIYLALPVVLVKLLLRALQNNSYFDRVIERFGFTRISVPAKGYWIHAVSVGEVNAAVPLVNHLLNTNPAKSITITTMTTTGADRVSKVFGSKVFHCYLPYDYPGAVRRFLFKIKPALAVIMETEIWPNLIFRCQRNDVPIIYANVRLSERSWRGYKRFKGLIKPTLEKVSCFAVQSKPDAIRLIQLGAPEHRVKVTGSIKFDIDLPPSLLEAGEAIRRQLGWHRPVMLAASTHDGEEVLILDAFRQVRKDLNETLLVLVPRHPERFNSVARICQKQKFSILLRSEMPAIIAESCEILVVDTMGELPMFIAASDVTFMAGSLVPIGGHNILEAGALARPVIFGPHMFNFAEISEMFLGYGAGIQVFSTDELSDVMIRLLSDSEKRDQYGKQGEKLVKQNRGALNKVLEYIKELVPQEST